MFRLLMLGYPMWLVPDSNTFRSQVDKAIEAARKREEVDAPSGDDKPVARGIEGPGIRSTSPPQTYSHISYPVGKAPPQAQNARPAQPRPPQNQPPATSKPQPGQPLRPAMKHTEPQQQPQQQKPQSRPAQPQGQQQRPPQQQQGQQRPGQPQSQQQRPAGGRK